MSAAHYFKLKLFDMLKQQIALLQNGLLNIGLHFIPGFIHHANAWIPLQFRAVAHMKMPVQTIKRTRI
jgi:hypothetical protein